MKSTITKILCAVMTFMLLLGITACTPSQQGQNGDEPALNNNTSNVQPQAAAKMNVNFGLTGDPQSMDPSKTTDQMSKAVWYQMYDTCIMRDNDGNHFPGLAESWDISDDGKILTLNIRKGVKFHDGTELKAEDIAFSLGLLCDSPQTTSKMVSMTSDRINAVEEYTVRIDLEAPFGAILDVLSCDTRIISKNAYESLTSLDKGTQPFAVCDG